MMNMANMMKKAQDMQKKMEVLQEELAQQEVQGTSGGGLISVTMTCKGAVKNIKIDPSLVTPDDCEIMEDLIVAAMNDARQKADAQMAEETQKAMGDMGLPAAALGGMGGLPF